MDIEHPKPAMEEKHYLRPLRNGVDIEHLVAASASLGHVGTRTGFGGGFGLWCGFDRLRAMDLPFLSLAGGWLSYLWRVWLA